MRHKASIVTKMVAPAPIKTAIHNSVTHSLTTIKNTAFNLREKIMF